MTIAYPKQFTGNKIQKYYDSYFRPHLSILLHLQQGAHLC